MLEKAFLLTPPLPHPLKLSLTELVQELSSLERPFRWALELPQSALRRLAAFHRALQLKTP
jgi:hypothetical protein